MELACKHSVIAIRGGLGQTVLSVNASTIAMHQLTDCVWPTPAFGLCSLCPFWRSKSNPGLYGPDCASPYCVPDQVITALSGTISDHNGGGNYRITNIAAGWSTQQTVSRTQLFWPFSDIWPGKQLRFCNNPRWRTKWGCHWKIYRKHPSSTNFCIHRCLSTIAPVTDAGAMWVAFDSDDAITRTGFEATFTSCKCYCRLG